MGFMLPALPLIGKIGGAIVGGLMSKKAQKEAGTRSPEEMQALGGAQNAAGFLGKAGQGLLGQGQQDLNAPRNYFQTLLRGNRAAMSQAVAGPSAQITDYYRGAERDLDRQGIRGAGREVAASELGRDRASSLSGLVTGVQPYAAEQLAGMGQNQLQLGGGLAGQAGNLYSHLLGAGAQNRGYARQQGQEAGQAWSKTIQDIWGSIPWPKGKPRLPATSQTFPPTGGATYPPMNPGVPALPSSSENYPPGMGAQYPEPNRPQRSFGGVWT